MTYILRANALAAQKTKVARKMLPSAIATPVVSPGGNKQDWLILVIKNTTAKKALAALFDASGKFELKDGIQTQDGVTIESTNYDYAAFLNDLASTEQIFVRFWFQIYVQ